MDENAEDGPLVRCTLSLRCRVAVAGRGLAASTARGARLILLDPDGGHADVSSALPAEVRKAPATCVDWHPTDAVAAFGAADKTVTVASLKIE